MKTIKAKNLPSRLPGTTTLLVALAMDVWNAPEWLWGCMACLFTVWWIAAIVVMYKTEAIDIFEDDPKPKDNSHASKFREKLEEAMNRQKN